MTALDEVKKMQQEGLTEDVIIKDLREKGFPYKDITEAFSQSKIKAAVEQPQTDPASSMQRPPPAVPQPSPPNAMPPTSAAAPPAATPMPPIPSNQGQPPQGEMQQSIMQSEQMGQAPAPPMPSAPVFTEEVISPPTPPGFQDEYSQQAPGAAFDSGGYGDYQDYDYNPSAGLSSDTVSEISEQIISEKMSDVRKHLEKVTDFRTVVETKVESLDDRLKRIEKILDTLQTSILRKVGGYVSNVDDIKKELLATQKSFSKLVPELKKASHKKTTTRKRKSHSKKKK